MNKVTENISLKLEFFTNEEFWCKCIYVIAMKLPSSPQTGSRNLVSYMKILSPMNHQIAKV